MEEILERVKKGIQYRDMMLGVDESGEKRVNGYATTFNEPYTLYEDEDMVFMEQVDRNAFDNADMSDVIMQYDHRGRVFARTRNNTLDLRTDAKGLFVSANLGGTEIGKQLYEEIRGGYTDKMSFAFTVSGENLDRRTENNRRIYLRTITQIKKVFDVSAVSIPANDGTSISARSFVDGIIDEEKKEALRKLENEQRRKRLQLRLRLMGG
jgi:HK97 family phage prohead protease